MLFNGRGHNPVSLPPLPDYEPRMAESQIYAGRSYPLLNILVQVVGSRGTYQ
jgi:sterol 3beta-glucosyltransferase